MIISAGRPSPGVAPVGAVHAPISIVRRALAEFAFRQAERTGAKVFGGPRYTVSPTDEEIDASMPGRLPGL